MPKNITLVLNHLVDGGAARVAVYLTHAWAEMGRKVTILTSDDGKRPALYKIHPTVVHRPLALQGMSHNAFEAVAHNCRILARLRRAILESQPDLLVSFLDTSNVRCLLATRGLRKIPTIVSERSDPHGWSIGFAWEKLRRLTYPWADCLVVQSQHALSYFPPSVQAKGIVIPNPVQFPTPETVHPPKPKGARSKVVTLGRLSQVKGHDMLVDAFAPIAEAFPNWDLVIYGDGPEREVLTARIVSCGLENRILLPGNTTEVEARLREADLFVLPSRVEGFPNALAEAMACGLPVISFDCASGPSELIRPGVDGVLVPPQNVTALSKEMARLMSDPSERNRLAACATEVLERFSLEKIIKLWEDTLGRVCIKR